MANDGNQVEPTPKIEGNPSPQISGDQGGQGLSQAGGQSVDFSALQKDPEFNAFIEKMVQSKQDSRLGKYDTRLEKLEGSQEATIAKYEALVGSGMTKEQAVDRMKLDKDIADLRAFRESIQGGDAPSQPSAGTGEKPWTERQASILEEAGIRKDDRRLSDLLKQNTFASHEEYLKVLADKTFEWKQADVRKPEPSSSTVAQTVPSIPAGDGTYTKEKYKTDMLAARGNRDELKRIKAAAKADGVDVDNIGFV